MKHDHFFSLLSVALILLIAALVTPALLGRESDVEIYSVLTHIS